ncbi:hypothetical protein DV735_g1384, partial [Chaetothyriales sp. CBS 134920]
MSEWLNREKLLALATIDPELDVLVKANPLPKPRYDDLAAFKQLSEKRGEQTRLALGEPPADVKQSELQYTTLDGHKVRAKLYQPQPARDHSPLIVLFHGGGFCIGTPEGEEQTSRNLVQAFGATVVSAGYRLAPEFPFPYAITDAWDALRWAAANAKSWDADPAAGFIVGGTSAGGSISAALALLARDEKLSPPLTGQYLVIPATVSPSKVPAKYKEFYLSREQNVNDFVLPREAIELFIKAYNPDDDDPRYNPAIHPSGHKDLPPAVFVIDGADPLRDDGFIYEDILRENGTKTKVYVYPGLPHAHWGFFPSLKASTQFRKDQLESVGWLLGKTPDVSKVSSLTAKAASA